MTILSYGRNLPRKAANLKKEESFIVDFPLISNPAGSSHEFLRRCLDFSWVLSMCCAFLENVEQEKIRQCEGISGGLVSRGTTVTRPYRSRVTVVCHANMSRVVTSHMSRGHTQ